MKKNTDSGSGRKFGLPQYIMICIVLVALAVAATYFILMDGFGSAKYFADARKYVEIEKLIEDNYIEDIQTSTLYDSAAAALVRGTGDKWSYYMSPQEYEAYKLSKENEYAGIGVSIRANGGDFDIVSVEEGTPAAAAGLAPGMKIIAVDGTDVKGLSISEVQELIRTNLNRDFKITVDNDGEKQNFTVACEIIYKNPVSSKLTDDYVGYVRISNFEAGASDAAIEAIEKLIEAGAESFLFDVRDNPGGLISELTKLLDYLLPDGDIFVSIDRDGNEKVTKSDKMCLKYKMAVIINENTYSAAEFFAAALQEYGWATVVGQQTTGKARSQITIELNDGGAVHISTGKYLTPHRVDLSEAGGVNPDILALNDTEDGSDIQLSKALYALK